VDPLTAALIALASVIDLVKEIVKNQPPEVAAELWRLHLEDVKAWREFLKKIVPPHEEPKP